MIYLRNFLFISYRFPLYPFNVSSDDNFLEQLFAYSPSNDCDSLTGPTGVLPWVENETSEAPDAVNRPPSLPDENLVKSSSPIFGGSRELVCAISAETKGKGTMKRCRRRGPGESSPSRKRSKLTREANNFGKLIDGKSVAESAKILTDRLARKISNDRAADMASILFVVKLMMDSNSCYLLPQVLGSLDQIKIHWPMRLDIPVRSDIQVIKQNVKRIEDEFRNSRLSEAQAKLELIKEEKVMKNLYQQRDEDLKEVQNQVQKLEAMFIDNMPCFLVSDSILEYGFIPNMGFQRGDFKNNACFINSMDDVKGTTTIDDPVISG
ncbi:hypothetical protein F3Y22_tig00111303pilonHSYRG00133 [Hibiscus syriacus]|uniref:Uncharacterized protein n=1 Tax=Hibiscus syriacus TaxID=106335 RepID=A0A6A2YRE7_HIBSY|nr:hypothetical protein F3Y22_tig00111303pilonHSYRG00133 [Hibiscus syriacus]